MMKRVIAITLVSFLMVSSTSAYAERMRPFGRQRGRQLTSALKEADSNTFSNRRLAMISSILEEAGCALTDAQTEQLEAVERGPETREQVAEILTDEQEEALEAAREKFAGRRGRRGGHRMAAILKAAECPLTDTQIEQLESVERGPEARDQIDAILTNEQKEAFEAARAEFATKRHERTVQLLEDAGCPLTDAQIEQIEAIERGPEARGRVAVILTDEQRETLKAARAEHTGRRGRRGGHRMAAILEEAGCSLTDTQIEQIQAIEKGTDRREAMGAILTDDQKAALDAAFGKAEDGDDDITEAAAKPAAVEESPSAFNVLKQNYPNPFNPTTTIDYSIAKAGDVKFDVYSQGGQKVATLVESYQSAGVHSVVWDASDCAAGVYIGRITSGGFTQSMKMSLVK